MRRKAAIKLTHVLFHHKRYKIYTSIEGSQSSKRVCSSLASNRRVLSKSSIASHMVNSSVSIPNHTVWISSDWFIRPFDFANLDMYQMIAQYIFLR